MRVRGHHALWTIRNEHGAVAVIFALSLVVVLGMTALVVDLGGSLAYRRNMVAAADSAALAAARECADGQLTTAESKADEYAGKNAPGTTSADRVGPLLGEGGIPLVCTSATGSVTVSYQRVRDNVFGAILGQDTATVGATAEASWGPLGSGIPPPLILAQNPFAECFPAAVRNLPRDEENPASIATEPRCVLWFNTADVGNGQWGFMDLDTWGNTSPATNCAGTAPPQQMSTWIKEGYPTSLKADPPPVYVCLAPGTNPQGWTQDLHGERYQPGGKTGIRLFPVTDPSGTIAGPGKTKVAVVGFARVRIRFADWGANAAPSGGATNTCVSKHNNLAPGTVVVLPLDTAGSGCPKPADTVQTMGEPVVSYEGPDSQDPLPAVRCAGLDVPAGCHYSYDAVSRAMTWRGAKTLVEIEFDWITPIVGGTCTSEAGLGVPHLPPPIRSAAIGCVVISWPGPGTSAGYIGAGTTDFGVRAVDLTG